jgi:hypothetical protein
MQFHYIVISNVIGGDLIDRLYKEAIVIEDNKYTTMEFAIKLAKLSYGLINKILIIDKICDEYAAIPREIDPEIIINDRISPEDILDGCDWLKEKIR